MAFLARRDYWAQLSLGHRLHKISTGLPYLGGHSYLRRRLRFSATQLVLHQSPSASHSHLDPIWYYAVAPRSTGVFFRPCRLASYWHFLTQLPSLESITFSGQTRQIIKSSSSTIAITQFRYQSSQDSETRHTPSRKLSCQVAHHTDSSPPPNTICITNPP